MIKNGCLLRVKSNRIFRLAVNSSHLASCTELNSQVRWRNRGVRDHSTSSNHDQIKSDHAHCVELVEKRDHHGYLCGLLMPAKESHAYFALRAWNVEIASIKDSIDPRRIESSVNSTAFNPGQIRLQWWRDAIDDVYNEIAIPNHFERLNAAALHQPVMRSVSRAIRNHGWTRRYLERILDARENDMQVSQHSTVQDLVDYSEDTYSSLIYLSLETAQVEEELSYQVASHVGVATGIVTALRSTAPLASRRGELSIPNEIMRKHSLRSTYLLKPPARPAILHPDQVPLDERESYEALRGSVAELATVARAHLNEARNLQHHVPSPGRAACFLPAVPVLHYLERLERCHYDVLHPDINVREKTPLRLPLLLLRTWLTGHF